MLRRVLQVLLPLLVLGAGIMMTRSLILSRSKAEKRQAEPIIPLVQASSVSPGAVPVLVRAHGTVIPDRELSLQSQVQGRIQSLHPAMTSGGRVGAGEVLLSIDPRDYKLIIAEREAQIARAQLELETERGRSEIAKREWQLLGESAREVASELTLRKPHLLNAEAALAAAQSALARAELELERCELRAPFNAMVLDESLELGQLVNPQASLARLVGTDRFLVQASLPVADLERLELPDRSGSGGAKAEIQLDLGSKRQIRRQGRLLRILGELDPNGRMARVLIAVDAPFETAQGDEDRFLPLFLGAYVSVTLEGRAFDKAVRLPREALRSDSAVWLLDASSRLEIRPIEILWRAPESVVVQGLSEGERVITSRVPTPVAGTALRLLSGERGGQ